VSFFWFKSVLTWERTLGAAGWHSVV